MRFVDAARYDAAMTFPAYLGTVVNNAELWHGMYRTCQVPSGFVSRARAFNNELKLLALSEDWCGDAVSTLPVLARLAEQAAVELRILARDANPDLMDQHLTSGSRSIPVIMFLDLDLRERGWWGPRPAPIQRWMRTEGLMLPRDERNRKKRAWYARDRGRTVLVEVIEGLERARRAAAPKDPPLPPAGGAA
jgi:hypothetical protein